MNFTGVSVFLRLGRREDARTKREARIVSDCLNVDSIGGANNNFKITAMDEDSCNVPSFTYRDGHKPCHCLEMRIGKYSTGALPFIRRFAPN